MSSATIEQYVSVEACGVCHSDSATVAGLFPFIVFNALRNNAAKPPDTVAILGMGGLGHLGVQFAHELGARHYIDSTATDMAESLQSWAARR